MDTLADAVHVLHVETDVGVERASVEALDEQFVILTRHVPEELKSHMLLNTTKYYNLNIANFTILTPHYNNGLC